jgi:hypothetical protein
MCALVHGSAAVEAQKARKAEPAPAASVVRLEHDPARLPEKVREMRDAILAAARSGDIEALRTPLEWNELKPEIGGSQGADPVAVWRKASGDGEGREILAVLIDVLEAPYAVVDAGGKDARFVWPGYAEVALSSLSPADEVGLYRLLRPAEANAMRDAGRWTWWRLVIGADGTWHSFVKAE